METSKYQNGKIYKIESQNTTKIYIGSTTKSLDTRLKGHVRNFLAFINDESNSYLTSFDIISKGFYNIKLIENYPCDTKEKLHIREGEFITQFRDVCINQRIPGRSPHEYYIFTKQQKQKYYEEHRDDLLKYKKEYYKKNKNHLLETHRKWENEHADELKEKYDTKQDCFCGGIFTYRSKLKHVDSVKHQTYCKENPDVYEIDFGKEILCKICNSTYDPKYESRHLASKTHQKYVENKQETECPCGSTFFEQYRYKHEATKKHKQYLESIKEDSDDESESDDDSENIVLEKNNELKDTVKQKVKFTCECGSIMNTDSNTKNKHYKTKKHRKFISSV